MNEVTKKNEYVYCSGPMFSPGNLETMAKIAATIEAAGYPTYLPQRDGLEVAKIMGMVNNPLVSGDLFQKIITMTMKAIFCVDIYQLVERTSYLVFNRNGRVPDEGSVVETSIAFAAGKPLVIYKQDPRAVFMGHDNPMVTGLSYTFSYVDAIEKIPAELTKIIKKVPVSPYLGDTIPIHVREISTCGKLIWNMINDMRILEKDGDALVKALIRLVDEVEKIIKHLL